MEKRKAGTNDKTTLREVLELHRLEEQFKVYKNAYEAKRKSLTTSISNYMFSRDYKTFKFRSREFGAVKVNKIVRKTVVWDVDKLKKKLSSEVFTQVAEKQYTINDIDGLAKYLKSCGVSPKKFKKFIDVETKIDNARINHLSEIGDITSIDIQGCYTLKEASPYLRIDVEAIEMEKKEHGE